MMMGVMLIREIIPQGRLYTVPANRIDLVSIAGLSECMCGAQLNVVE